MIPLSAQTKSDSLLTQYEETAGRQRIAVANQIFQLLNDEEVTDSLIHFDNTAHQDTVAATLYYWMGEQKFYGQDFVRGVAYFNKALEFLEKGKDIGRIGDSYNDLAICYARQGLFQEALEAATRSVEMGEQLKDKERLVTATNIVGCIYMMAKQSANGEKHLLRSLQLAQELNDSVKIAVRYGTLSELRQTLGDNQKAVEYARQALRMDSLRGDRARMAVRRVQLASPLFAMGRTDEAEAQLNEARPVLEAAGNKVSLAICLNQMGYVALKKEQWNKAAQWFEQSIAIYAQTGERFSESKAEWGLWQALQHIDIRQAAAHLEKYAILKDTLYQQDVARMTAEYEARYQHNELRLMNEQEKQKNKMLLIIGATIGLVLLGGVLIQLYILRLKRKNSRMKTQLDQVRDQLLTPADREFVSRVDQLLDKQFRSFNVDLEQLASELCITRSQLNRKMKAILDQSMSEHVSRVRIERAKRLIEDGEMSISEVARACGIDDVAYFSRLFRKQSGMSPSEYKSKQKA